MIKVRRMHDRRIEVRRMQIRRLPDRRDVGHERYRS